LDGYKKIKHGASKADLWRYLVIYKYGGVYADSDCRCLLPLREWVNPDSEYVTQLGINHDVCQWLIISVPKNPIFLRAAEKSLENLRNDRSAAQYRGFELINERLEIRQVSPLKVNDHVMGLAGPPVLQEAAEECFNDGSITRLMESTQVVCVSGRKSCQMNGNVTHDCGNVEYLRALKELNTRHYRDNGPFLKALAKLKRWCTPHRHR
jgi:mannosyltransferase OCH1-like enzyme